MSSVGSGLFCATCREWGHLAETCMFDASGEQRRPAAPPPVEPPRSIEEIREDEEQAFSDYLAADELRASPLSSTRTPAVEVSPKMWEKLRAYARAQVAYCLACERTKDENHPSSKRYEAERDAAYKELSTSVASLESRVETAEQNAAEWEMEAVGFQADLSSLRSRNEELQKIEAAAIGEAESHYRESREENGRQCSCGLCNAVAALSRTSPSTEPRPSTGETTITPRPDSGREDG